MNTEGVSKVTLDYPTCWQDVNIQGSNGSSVPTMTEYTVQSINNIVAPQCSHTVIISHCCSMSEIFGPLEIKWICNSNQLHLCPVIKKDRKSLKDWSIDMLTHIHTHHHTPAIQLYWHSPLNVDIGRATSVAFIDSHSISSSLGSLNVDRALS